MNAPLPGTPIAGRSPRFLAFLPPDVLWTEHRIRTFFNRVVPRHWRQPGAAWLLIDPAADEKNQRWGAMLSALAESRCPDAAVLPLAHALIRTGEAACVWYEAGALKADMNARARAGDKDAVVALDAVRCAAIRLAQHLETPHHGAFAFATAAQKAGVSISQAALADFLRRYAACLPKLHTADRGPFLHRFVLGPAIFDKPLPADRRRWPDAATLIVFDAVAHARAHTSDLVLQRGMPMPATGLPLYRVAAEMARAITGKWIDGDQADRALAAFLRRNPTAQWHGW